MRKTRKNRLSRLLSSKRFRLVVFALLFGVVGTYLVLAASADDETPPPAVANPALKRSCGIDVALLIDPSGSMQGDKFPKAKNAMKEFVTALKGTQTYFSIAFMDTGFQTDNRDPAFSQNTAAVLQQIDALELGGGSELGDLTWITELDPRPSRQNLVIVLSDFRISYFNSNVSTLKQNGTRILALEINNTGGSKGDENIRPATNYIAGPNIDTGSVFTSDVITIKFDTIGSQFKKFAQQLCFSGGGTPGGSGDGDGNGSGGTGTGTNGQGQGTGPGSGAGGGSGSTANKQGDKPKPLPSSGGQGNKQQLKLKPSPFFDGKYYAPGSDPIDKIFGNLSVGGTRVIHGWLYLLGLLIILSASGWLGWKKLNPKTKARIKTKLRL